MLSCDLKSTVHDRPDRRSGLMHAFSHETDSGHCMKDILWFEMVPGGRISSILYFLFFFLFFLFIFLSLPIKDERGSNTVYYRR